MAKMMRNYCPVIRGNLARGYDMTDQDHLFAPNFKTEPFWWEAAPRPVLESETLPSVADVLVVGSGYTGLHAALQTARGGRHTVVCDAASLGFGCSTRNGGQVSTSIKPTYSALSDRYGNEIAAGIRRVGIDSLRFIDDFIQREEIQCEWARVGRFHGAHKPASYESMAREISNQHPSLEVNAYMVPAGDQRNEIGSDLYHGGVVFPDHAVLHPGKYHAGLVEKVRAAGADLFDHCAVENIEPAKGGFSVQTARGPIVAKDIVIATNGYTTNVTPWLVRRVIPIGSYIIATEPLDLDLAHSISPKGRIMSDSRKLVFYYRLCAETRRMVFGGRVALRETDPRVSAPKLHSCMSKIFPSLQDKKITHSWLGFVAYTFDTLAHQGKRNGMHYAMGYCGSGVGMASYLGMRTGQSVLQLPEGKTSFCDIPMPTKPLYKGNPWFLAPAVAYYKFRDKLNL